jgi:heptosyltransferase-1
VRVLVVKTSSLGDVIHTLPALTDAARALPGVVFDWAVEEAFAEIPAWHPAVARVIPVALRRWRRQILQTLRGGELQRCKNLVRQQHYDCVIDAQGLLKSAWVARWAGAPVIGLDRNSAREPLAALAYRRGIAVPRQQHAVERVRTLFAAALGYQIPAARGDYGLDRSRFRQVAAQRRVVFVHGTTRADKHWPEAYWRELCARVTGAGVQVALPWGNECERARAERIAAVSPLAAVPPRPNLQGVAALLAQSTAAVAVDTGLGHLAAALDVPALSLYGPTSPALVGAYGNHQIHLQAGGLPLPAGVEPRAMAPLTPERVWRALAPLLSEDG